MVKQIIGTFRIFDEELIKQIGYEHGTLSTYEKGPDEELDPDQLQQITFTGSPIKY